MKSLGLEIRVGLLVLVSLGLLVGFIFVFGGISLNEGRPLYVDFNNPGALKPGAAVNIGSIRIGTVEELTYRGPAPDPTTGRVALIRVRLTIDPEIRDTIHDDAAFYVTSQGLLGESIIAVEPGSDENPILSDAPNMIPKGADVPRLDLALAYGFELLDSIIHLIRNNREELGDLLSNLTGIVRGLNGVLTDHRERIDRIIINVETATEQAGDMLISARGIVDGDEVRRTISNLDRTLAAVARDINPILRDARGAAHNANETLAAIGPEQRTQIQDTMRNASELAERANATIADAQSIVAHIESGQGTVGAILMDEEIYDDIQELLRDLKHNPWKLFWRE
jgi:phospholipid/cholesterol/gamma-HCH transport system substrate-binding protein